MSDTLPFRGHRRKRPALALAAGVVLLAAGVSLLRHDGKAAGPSFTPSAADSPFRPAIAPPLAVDTLLHVLSVDEAVHVAPAWVILDGRGHRIHVWSTQGPVRSFGGRGDGPGELDRPTHLDVSGTTVGVSDAYATRIDFFDLDRGYRARRALDAAGCPLGPVRGFLGTGSDSFMVLQSCTDPLRGTWPRITVLGPREGPRVVHEGDPTGIAGPPSLLDAPVLGRHGGRFYAGSLVDPCVRPVEVDPADPASDLAICHPRGTGPLLPDSMRTELEGLVARARRAGRRMTLPDRLPPLSGLASTPDELVFRVPLGDGSEAFDIVGEARLRRVLAPAESRAFVGAGRVLLARDLVEGTELRLVPLAPSLPDPSGDPGGGR